jgi:hypothetical protein
VLFRDRESVSTDKMTAQNMADDTFMKILMLLEGQGRSVTPNKGPSYAPREFANHPDAGEGRLRGQKTA